MKAQRLTHQFVEFIPADLEDGTLYVSMEYATVIHLCACGCGERAVTPLSPADWQLTYDGETVSLTPSIGNWSFDCQSHYWLENGRVIWDEQFSKRQIARVRALDQAALSAAHEDVHAQRSERFTRPSRGRLGVLWHRLRRR